MFSLSILEIAVRAVLATLIGGLIGLERGKTHSAGIRTHSIVSLGACLIMLTNIYIGQKYQIGDPSRMGAQVVSGIGFLGAGTIMVTNENKVKGLTTAAGLWLSAGIGLAMGIGFYEGVIVSVILLALILTAIRPLKIYIQKRSKMMDIYLVVNSMEAYNRVLIYCAENKVDITETKSAFGEVSQTKLSHFKLNEIKIASFITLKLNNHFEHLKLMEEISMLPGIMYIEEV